VLHERSADRKKLPIASHEQASCPTAEGIDTFDVDTERAMIVLGLTASLMASLTLAAFTLLCRIEQARGKTASRVL
jgi:hypothetical protein